ncbi:MAG: FAD-dependent oxidoreductase [Angelakisella sp.]
MHHVIIGASAAGLTAAKTIRDQKPSDSITVISKDAHIYSRCMLHMVLSGKKPIEGINFMPKDFFEVNNIVWRGGETVSRVEAEKNLLHMESGEQLSYDTLLIATGSAYFVPPIQGFREAKNVFGLRDYSDVEQLNTVIATGKRCVIIGSGLVGLDAASALCTRGVSCSVVELADRMSPLQLDATAAAAYQTRFEAAGCAFYLSEKAAGSELDSDGNITAVLLESGVRIPCDFVLVSAGVRPSFGLLAGSGVETDRAVKVNAFLCANVPNIWAAGDVAGISGIWPNAMSQGEVAAYNMCGIPTEYVDKAGVKNILSFYGLTTISLGTNAPAEGDEVVVQQTEKSYKRVVLRDNVVTHVILQGDISNNDFWQALVTTKLPVGKLGKSVFELTSADFSKYEPKQGVLEL